MTNGNKNETGGDGGEMQGGVEQDPKEPSQEQLNEEIAKNKKINEGNPGTDNSESEGQTSGDGAGVGTG